MPELGLAVSRGEAPTKTDKSFLVLFFKKELFLLPRRTIMGKGDKQRGNREAKKPKADKKVAPAGSTFLKPQAEPRKPGGKPASK
jgi:hypothetical protein